MKRGSPNAHIRHRDNFFAKGLPFYTYVGNEDKNDGFYTKEFPTGEVHLVKRIIDTELNVEEIFLKVLRSAAA